MTIAERLIRNSIHNINNILQKCREIEPSDSWDEIKPTEVVYESNDCALINTNNENRFFIYLETRDHQIARMLRVSKLDMSPVFFPEYFFCQVIDGVCVAIIDGGEGISENEKATINFWNGAVEAFRYEEIHRFIHEPLSEEVFTIQLCSFLKKSFADGYLVTKIDPKLTFYKEGTGFFTVAPFMTRFSNPEKLLKLIENASKEDKTSDDDEEEYYDDEQETFV